MEKQQEKKSFLYGYCLNIFVGLMFFCYSALTVACINVTIPAQVEKYGWDYSATVSLSTYGFLLGVVFAIIFAQIVKTRGNKPAIMISLFLGGICALFYGHVSNFYLFAILNCIVYACAVAFGTVMTGTLTANWFPRKRGIVLGFSSVGLPAGEFLWLPICAFLLPRIGVSWTMTAGGILWCAVGIAAFFWVKERPEDICLVPDGDFENQEDTAKIAAEMEAYQSPWTVGRLLRCPAVWFQGILYGCLFFLTIGIIGQMVGFFSEKGIGSGVAVTMVSMTALSGIIGSIFWGFLDGKFGTKRATIVYAIFYCIVVILLLNVNTNVAFAWFAALAYAFANGGIGNLSPSMMVQVFGRWDLPAASRVINPITGLIRALPFAVIGVCVSTFGTISSAYNVMLGVAIFAIILSILQPDKMIGRKD